MFNQPNLLERVFYFITELGGPAVIVLTFLATSFFLWRNHKDLLKCYVSLFLASEAVVYLLKFLINKPRPLGAILYGETGGSMPSGHAAAAIFIYGFICYLISAFYYDLYHRKIVTLILVLLIVAIGLSRLYLDVHYLSDVAAGYLVGGSFLWLLISQVNSRKNS